MHSLAPLVMQQQQQQCKSRGPYSSSIRGSNQHRLNKGSTACISMRTLRSSHQANAVQLLLYCLMNRNLLRFCQVQVVVPAVTGRSLLVIMQQCIRQGSRTTPTFPAGTLSAAVQTLGRGCWTGCGTTAR
jgi:hypothetical protein